MFGNHVSVYIVGSLLIGAVAGGVCHGVANLEFWAIILIFHLTCGYYVVKSEKPV